MGPLQLILLFGTFCILFVAIIINMLWLIVLLFSTILGYSIKYAPFGWTTVVVVALIVVLLSYGFFVGRWRLCTKSIFYVNENVPKDFDGYRIIHISDLHLSTFDDGRKHLEKIVETINGLSPDLICFTGDLVTIGCEEAEPYTDILKQISARDGVVSVLGNHDFLIYSRRFKTREEQMAAIDSLADYERNVLGWNLLRNSSLAIESQEGNSHITIVGIDNKSGSSKSFRTINCGDIKKAVAGTDGFKILLSHDPSLWDDEVQTETDIPLTLSGHTHAAQISIFGWDFSSLIFQRSYGRYDENGKTIYVNPGLGCTAPFRIGARPEITVITLHH